MGNQSIDPDEAGLDDKATRMAPTDPGSPATAGHGEKPRTEFVAARSAKERPADEIGAGATDDVPDGDEGSANSQP